MNRRDTVQILRDTFRLDTAEDVNDLIASINSCNEHGYQTYVNKKRTMSASRTLNGVLVMVSKDGSRDKFTFTELFIGDDVNIAVISLAGIPGHDDRVAALLDGPVEHDRWLRLTSDYRDTKRTLIFH